MAKVGYIFKADRYSGFEADKEWMQEYGCVQVIEGTRSKARRYDLNGNSNGGASGGQVVVAKFSNALRGARELSAFSLSCAVSSGTYHIHP